MERKQVFLVLFVLLGLAVVGLGLGHILHARTEKASSACVLNLRQIVAGKQQWALEHPKEDRPPTWDDLRPYIGRGHANQIPVCPSGGTYTIHVIKELPTCSIGGRDHTLSPGKG